MTAATISLNKNFTLIIGNIVKSYPYAEFIPVIKSLTDILITSGSIDEKKYQKYKSILLENGFTEGKTEWNHVSFITDAEIEVKCVRVNFHKA